MSEALVSCIVPVFNGERYVAEALDSILAQTYRPLEVIVVDDGSTDGTAEVVAQYDDPVRYYRQSNAGPAAARNTGLTMAQGAFVAFLDADDLWHAEKLSRQMVRFADRPQLDLCVTHIQNFWIPEMEQEAKQFHDDRFSQPLPGYLTVTLLARRAVFDTFGPFDPTVRHAEDVDWFLRAKEQQIVMELLPDTLVYRRMHQANMTREVVAGREALLRVTKAALDRRRRPEEKTS